MARIKLAIVGTQGVPAQYGGFETLVEFLLDYLKDDFDITVFCSSKVYKEKLSIYKGCKLEYINFYPNGLQSIIFDIISIIKSVNRFDRILILGVSGGIIFPFLKPYSKKFILNIGGLDWKRSKWGLLTQKFLKLSERYAILNSGYLISDNVGIKEYITEQYKRDSKIVAYGGDHVECYSPTDSDLIKYSFLNENYAFSVARIQPDNNIDMILDAFTENPALPVVFMGNWNNSKYGQKTRAHYSQFDKIILLDAIYDRRELNLLRSNCKIYLHGHSAGGTNPALVEAMSLGLPVIAYSSVFNIYTTQNSALYFGNTLELKNKISSWNQSDFNLMGNNLKQIARNNYTWKIISDKYAEIVKMTDYGNN